MKNIAVLSFLVIILLPLFPAFSQEQSGNRAYSFSLGTQLGFVHGQSLEFVYQGNNTGELLSELRYDMEPVFYLGLQADFGRADLMSAPGVFTSLSFKIGIPGDSGTHQNRDWRIAGTLTDFSSHTNKTRDFYWLDALFGISIPVRSNFYITPFLSGSWMHLAFTGRDGHGFYIWRTPPDVSFEGSEVIHYKQDWFIIAVGFSAGTNIFYPFSFAFSFQISPFSHCIATDQHLTNNRTFRDNTARGLFLEPRGRVSFALNRFDFSLEAAYRYIGRTIGPSRIDDGNTGHFVPSGDAGAGLSLFDGRFLVSLRI